LVMIALDPDNLDAAFGIRKFADVRKKTPVIFLEPAEVEIAEDIAEKNKPAEAVASQHPDGIARTAEARAQVQIGNNDRVGDVGCHRLSGPSANGPHTKIFLLPLQCVASETMPYFRQNLLTVPLPLPGANARPCCATCGELPPGRGQSHRGIPRRTWH